MKNLSGSCFAASDSKRTHVIDLILDHDQAVLYPIYTTVSCHSSVPYIFVLLSSPTMKGQHHDRVLHEHVDPWRGAPIPIQHRPSSLMFPPGPDLNRWGSHPEDAAPSHVENPQPYLLQASQATVSFTSNVPFAWSDESNHFNSAISNAPASINDNRSVRLQPSQNFVAAENPQRYEANLRPDHVTQQPPSNAPRRSRNAPLDWNTHRADIGKFYIDEDNSLEETREKMANGFGFHAS